MDEFSFEWKCVGVRDYNINIVQMNRYLIYTNINVMNVGVETNFLVHY